MKVGEVYVMQRGPSRRALTVTLLDTVTDSGVRGRVLVRVEDGVGRGREIEAPTSSLHPLYEQESQQPATADKPSESRPQTAPEGWMPTCRESVTWERTGGIIFEVRQLTRGAALIEGELLGVPQEFKAPLSELAPAVVAPPAPRSALSIVEVDDSDLKMEEGPGVGDAAVSPLRAVEPPSDDWVEELIFSPKCIAFYRGRFARRKSIQAAEQKLREELHKARKVRPQRGGAYLCLRVGNRFEAILRESPTRGSADALYIDGLRDLRRRRRRKAA
jgi:hypothetical protein